MREFKANIAYFLPVWVGHNHIVNTKFTRPAPEICKSTCRYVTNTPLIDERKEKKGNCGGNDDEFYNDLLSQLVVDEKLSNQTRMLAEAL